MAVHHDRRRRHHHYHHPHQHHYHHRYSNIIIIIIGRYYLFYYTKPEWRTARRERFTRGMADDEKYKNKSSTAVKRRPSFRRHNDSDVTVYKYDQGWE